MLDLDDTVIADGCAAFSIGVHDVAIASLGTVSSLVTCDEAVELFEKES